MTPPIRAVKQPPACSASSSLASAQLRRRRLVRLDGIAVRILDLDLAASRTDLHLVPEPRTRDLEHASSLSPQDEQQRTGADGCHSSPGGNVDRFFLLDRELHRAQVRVV